MTSELTLLQAIIVIVMYLVYIFVTRMPSTATATDSSSMSTVNCEHHASRLCLVDVWSSTGSSHSTNHKHRSETKPQIWTVTMLSLAFITISTTRIAACTRRTTTLVPTTLLDACLLCVTAVLWALLHRSLHCPLSPCAFTFSWYDQWSIFLGYRLLFVGVFVKGKFAGPTSDTCNDNNRQTARQWDLSLGKGIILYFREIWE